jgi:Protein of unknown function (DUF3703)
MLDPRSYDDEILAGEAELKQRNLDAARMHFGRAHGLGHGVRCRHVMAHRRMLDVAVAKFDVREIASQAALIAMVYMFDRPAARG